uniref:Uncharacterized protein n=1 Tax=Cacopsylla melanoneura TaxID=428564 RepID=A0A8D8XQA8_9HEMI
MEYGIAFWDGSSSADSIFILQKRAIRSIFLLDSRSSCRGLFKSNKILTFYGSFILRLLSLFHHYSHTFPSHAHSYSTRGGGRLIIPRVNHTSYYYLGVTLYNKIPAELKSLNQKLFIDNLKKILIELEPYTIEDFNSANLT